MAHALLSPSSASRWLECPPSARLEEKLPDTTKVAAEEGTLAHSIGETILRRYVGQLTDANFSSLIANIREHELFTEDMMAHAQDYAAHVIEVFSKARFNTPDAILEIEAQLDMSDYVPEGFGTGDAVIIADGCLYIIDLKYGKGVAVSCENNKQMMLYALGALKAYDYMYALDRVSMTIFQPRMDNISTFEMDVNDLKAWADNVLKPTAALAFEGKGEYKPGSHCRFCKAKAICKAHADEQMKLAAYDFQDGCLLSDEQVADILTRADSFTNWLNSVQEYALLAAVEDGKHWPGYKLVEGRSNRTYADEAAVAKTVLKAGYKEDQIYTKKLLGITAMEKLITKKNFEALLSPLVIKPVGKPTLVPLADKRPEWNSAESAKSDFSE